MTALDPQRSDDAIRSDEASLPRPGARVTHLLDVARSAFVAHGYAHVSVDQVARLAGVSKETIYRHFPDKRALFDAAIRRMREAFSSRIEHLGEETDDPAELLARFAIAVQDSAAGGGHLAPVWLGIAIAREFPELAEGLRTDDLARLEPVREALQRIARRRGAASSVDIEHAAALGSLAVEGVRHVMGWAPDKPDDREAHARAVAQLFLNGCLAESGPREATPASALPPLTPPPPRADHISALMTVARRHFFEFGYRGASLDQIGAEARVGRGTLYRHFDGKAGLFEAVMLDAAHELAEECAAAAPVLPADAHPQAALLPFARVAGQLLNGAHSIALHRTVIAEAKRAPRLARQVYATSRLNLTLPLSAYLATGAAAGRFHIEDADWHARQLLTLATGGTRALGAAASPDASARERLAQRAVATFLRGYTAALG